MHPCPQIGRDPGTGRHLPAGAQRAAASGFDGVELHAANGYLVDVFGADRIGVRVSPSGTWASISDSDPEATIPTPTFHRIDHRRWRIRWRRRRRHRTARRRGPRRVRATVLLQPRPACAASSGVGPAVRRAGLAGGGSARPRGRQASRVCADSSTTILVARNVRSASAAAQSRRRTERFQTNDRFPGGRHMTKSCQECMCCS
jgi:hypothetical protein